MQSTAKHAQVSTNYVIEVHYNLKDDNNELVDTTYDEISQWFTSMADVR